MLIDFAHVLAPLTTAKGSGAHSTELWDPRWRFDLISAIDGGQWPQTSKAANAECAIDDTRCQLCLQAPGTLEHRAHCTATMPPKGWPTAPAKAARLLGRLSAQRRRVLATRGLLVLRLPAPPHCGDGHFSWRLQPDCADTLGTRWYFDGSMLNGPWKPYRSTGFGVVVTSEAGHLLGFGNGAPPPWCKTAASAEAWALQTILSITPFTK